MWVYNGLSLNLENMFDLSNIISNPILRNRKPMTREFFLINIFKICISLLRCVPFPGRIITKQTMKNVSLISNHQIQYKTQNIKSI